MYYLKFIGTDNNSNDYATMIANTVLNTSRWELELAVLSCVPKYLSEGEESTSAFMKVVKKSRLVRLNFEIEFVPFVVVPTDGYPNTTETRMQLVEQIFSKKAVWIVAPASEELLPRYNASTGFARVKNKLPCRVEPDFSEPSLDKDNQREDLTLTLPKYLI